GAGVGANASYSGGSSMSCTGDLWSYQGIDPGNATVSQSLHSGGFLGGAVTVGQNGYVIGPFNGSGSFAGDLYTPTCPAPGGYPVWGTCKASPGLRVAPPCSCCAPADQVPIQSYIDHYAIPANNDDAAIGFSPSKFDNGGSSSVLVLPCGYYY